MNKNMTLQQSNSAAFGIVNEIFKSVVKPFELLRKYYSDVLGEPVSMARMWRMVHAQVAFLSIVLPYDEPLLLRAACCGWFLWAVLKCKESRG